VPDPVPITPLRTESFIHAKRKTVNQEIYVKVYLDVCCLCRPFDDQLIPRIRNESEAVIAILNRCSLDWELIWSSAITYEVAKIIDHDKKHYISTFAAKTTTNILVDLAIKERAAVFMDLGVNALDALHVACAERAGATVLITTDDALKNIMCHRSDITSIKNREPCCMV
jgi:predicted nucleic acid-binding protein